MTSVHRPRPTDVARCRPLSRTPRTTEPRRAYPAGAGSPSADRSVKPESSVAPHVGQWQRAMRSCCPAAFLSHPSRQTTTPNVAEHNDTPGSTQYDDLVTHSSASRHLPAPRLFTEVRILSSSFLLLLPGASALWRAYGTAPPERRGDTVHPMVPSASAPLEPPCPECRSLKTIQAHDHLHETRYLCTNCEHAGCWSTFLVCQCEEEKTASQ